MFDTLHIIAEFKHVNTFLFLTYNCHLCNRIFIRILLFGGYIHTHHLELQISVVVASLEADRPGFSNALSTSYLTSLRLNLFICKLGWWWYLPSRGSMHWNGVIYIKCLLPWLAPNEYIQLSSSLEWGRMCETEDWRQPVLSCKLGAGKMGSESIIYLKTIHKMKLKSLQVSVMLCNLIIRSSLFVFLEC